MMDSGFWHTAENTKQRSISANYKPYQLGMKLRVSDRRRMAFIGRKKVNYPPSEPNEHSSDSHYHLPYNGNIWGL